MPPLATTPPADGTPMPAPSPALQTLDAATAIGLMDNSTELYQEIAHAYLREIADFPRHVDALLQKADLQAASRALHSLKGLSLTVGAHRLADMCRQCELQLKSLVQCSSSLDEAGRKTMASNLAGRIADTQRALEAALATPDPQAPTDRAPAASAADTQALLVDLQKLRDLLARSDLQAVDLFATLSARHPVARERMLALEQAVKAFDFTQAVVQCEEIIRLFGDTNRR